MNKQQGTIKALERSIEEYLKESPESTVENDLFLKILTQKLTDLKEHSREFAEVKSLYEQIKEYDKVLASLQVKLQDKVKDLDSDDLKKFNTLVTDTVLKSMGPFCNCNDTDTSDCIIEGH